MFDTHFIKKTFVRQQDSSDCGVACLRSVLKLYRGDISLERLRDLSGTGKQGTTLLGLYEAAQKIGFDTEGYETDISGLIAHNEPTILHVIVEENLEHYVVWYGCSDDSLGTDKTASTNSFRHVIGNPAKGIMELTDDELAKIWKSGRCLTLCPNNYFVTTKYQNKTKRDWFLKLIHDDIGQLAAGAMLGLAMAILGMAMAIFSQKLIDDILPSKNLTKLFAGIVLVACVILIRVGLEMLRTYILLRQSRDFNNRIIFRFYDNLLHLPKSFFDSRKAGDIVARMNDTSRIQRVIGQLAGQILVDVFVVFVSIGFLFFYSWEVGVALLACIPIYFILLYRFHLPISEKQRQVMTNYALNESNFISTLQGVRSIKSLNRQSVFGQINRTLYGAYQAAIVALGMVQLRLNLYASVSGVLILISILSYTSYQVLRGNLKAGELMAILGMSSSLLPAVASLALMAIPVNEAKIAFDRMFEFAGLTSEDATDAAEMDKLHFQELSITNLTFRFPGRKAILNDLSLELKRGEIIGIVGESGCGKSTLVQLIERFYEPETGSVRINKTTDLTAFPLSFWRKNIACVPQDVHIFSGTILDNVLLGLEPVPKHIEEFFNREPFFSFVNSLPHGVATLVGEEGLNLSGGQKQWVGIMRALYNKPQILLLDEATSAMDAQNEQQILKLLQQCRSEMGIVYVSHRLHTLPKLCDRIYVLEEGYLRAFGSHQELLATDNLYSRFWNELVLETM